MKKILIILLFGIVSISLCTQQNTTQPSGGGGGGGGGPSTPPSCSASFSLTSTGKDTCTIAAGITASYCDNKSYELKDNGNVKCSSAISGNSFSKTCSWTVSVGDYTYNLYVDSNLQKSLPTVCKASSTCSDGTFYESCSITKPLYCDNNGNLVNKCSFCECPEGQECNTTSEDCYSPLQCSGSASLSLAPSTTQPGSSVIPSALGLNNCAGKTIYFKNNSCSGAQVSSCTLTDGNCVGTSFTAPSSEGLYTYYACIDKNNDGDYTDSGEYSSKVFNVTENNREHILNYLNYDLEHGANIGLGNFIFTLDSYELLNEPIPNRSQVIEYLNSLQSDEGTWLKGQRHYVPITAQVLMFYNRSGVRPPKSLDTFFSTVDTWEKVNAHVNKYEYDIVDWGGVNYWGGLWGYITSYVVYKHEAPPWTSEYLNAVNTNFTDWAYDNHQRTHVIGNLLQLGLPIPRIDEVINIALGQQKADGSWGSHVAETVFMTQVLKSIKSQSSVNQNLIDSAIAKGVEYVKKCYKTADSDGKTYGGFVKNSTTADFSYCLSLGSPCPWYTAQGIWASLNPEGDIWSRWFVLNVLQNEIGHIDNSLEYLRSEYLKLGVPKVHDMAEYVISKNYLGTQIPNKQQIIDYFDKNQNQTDGSWKDVNTPMFTTYRILLAYYILNAKPNRSLDSFFSNYDTWEKALAYDRNIHGTFDGRDIYHIVLGWVLYYRTYPPWMNDFFTNIEKDLTWTNNTNSHKRTHILYSYVIARRQFPNLDGIINETLKEQSTDGHWDYQCLTQPRPVYCNAIQLVLLQQIIKLYPNHRTAEIQNSIDKSRTWVYNTYNTTTINGMVMGFFGTSTSIEDSVMVGVMSAGINGLMDINVDMTFEDIIPKT